MSASLNLLWALLNSLQIIVVMPLMNLNMPSDVISLNKVLNKIANFAVIPIEKYNHLVLNFSPNHKTKNDRFYSYEYETANFIINGQLLVWALALYFFFAILLLVFSPIIKGKVGGFL